LNYYNRIKISENLIKTFQYDVDSGKITFEMDENCCSYIMK